MTSDYGTGPTTTGNEAGEVFEALVSRYDDADFDGDWRYAAFSPDIDVATDGRTTDEALRRLKDAIRIKLRDYPTGQLPALSPAARAAAVADFLDDGRLVAKTTVSWVPSTDGREPRVMRREEGRIVPVPDHPGDIPPGTVRSIIRQAGWTVDEFRYLAELMSPGERQTWLREHPEWS